MNTGLHPFLETHINNHQRDISRSDYRSLWLDNLVADRYAGELPSQRAIVENSRKEGLPEIQVGAFEGHLIMNFLKLMGAKVGVEVGTLGGYSSSWIARALVANAQLLGEPTKLHTLELSEKFAAVAKQNLSPWASTVDVVVGPALNSLETTLSHLNNLDFVFIDADKASYPLYFEWAWQRLRKGGLILIDNFYLWGGVYFSREETFPRDFSNSLSERDRFTETQWRGMKRLWDRLESLGTSAEKTILPTSEGLGMVTKLS